jgi:hypothetical protein
MSLVHSPIVGTIRFEPVLVAGNGSAPCEDSTLGFLLDSFAHHQTLNDVVGPREPLSLFSHTRLSRIRAAEENSFAIQASLEQLREDLEAEYEQVAMRLVS